MRRTSGAAGARFVRLVLLAGVLLKLGTYGILRLCLPMFPYAAWILIYEYFGENSPTVFALATRLPWYSTIGIDTTVALKPAALLDCVALGTDEIR